MSRVRKGALVFRYFGGLWEVPKREGVLPTERLLDLAWEVCSSLPSSSFRRCGVEEEIIKRLTFLEVISEGDEENRHLQEAVERYDSLKEKEDLF